jgi:hypothetical protein
MKDDVKIKVPNETPMTLIPSNGVVNWDGVLKSIGRLEVDHTTHLWKDLSHKIQSKSVHRQMIQFKGDL